jgi:cation diffusion facilitator CzcD-associated flavoprotein CzcO
MHAPDDSVKTGGRLSGEDVRQYMEDFAERFLKGKIRFETEVLNLRRGDHGRGWKVLVREGGTGGKEKVLYYSRIILCTGVSLVCPSPLPSRSDTLFSISWLLRVTVARTTQSH